MAKGNYDYSGPMEERELIAVLEEEHRDASSEYDSEMAIDQAHALDRYFNRRYGDEVDGRSAVVDHTLEDAVSWAIPPLMRLFLNNDELITVTDETVDDQSSGDIAAEYLSKIFFEDMKGEEILHDMIFDGLLMRSGIVRVGWEEPKTSPPRRLKVPGEMLQQYLMNPEYEIVAQTEGDDGMWELEVRQTPRNGKPVVESVPPEEFAWSKRAKSVEDAAYHRRKQEVFLADLQEMFPESADELDPYLGTGASNSRFDDDLDQDPRVLARHEYEEDDPAGTQSYHQRRRKIELLTEYIYIDYDGDGVVELRQIKRVGDVILENIEVEKSEFCVWTPIRIAHRMAGRSMADQLADFQKIKTVLTRKLLDSLSQSLAPRRVVNKRLLGDAGVDQLLDHDIGDVIEADGDADAAIRDLVTPDVSQQAYAALEYFDQRTEEASGVTRHAQGLRAEAITDTARGIEALQTASSTRIELIGRWLALGVERVFRRLYEVVRDHTDYPVVRRINGEPTLIDPSVWSENAIVTIHVGVAAETREQKLAKLNAIAMKQEQILLQAGPDNPLVGWGEYRNTLAAMVQEAGFRDDESFFKEFDEEQYAMMQAQQAQQPDPEVQKAQIEAEQKQAEAQMDLQLEAQKSQAQMQLEAQKASAAQELQQIKLAADQQLQAAKLESERNLQLLKIQSERELAEMRIQAEQQLAFVRLNAEQELAREKAKIAAENGAQLPAQQPGGRLDA